MGYTHYWKSENLNEKKFKQAIKSMRLVLEQQKDILEIPKKRSSDSLSFNGIGEDGHEDFFLALNLNFNFCKTARKPYDIAVVACLCILEHFCPDAGVSSDGHPDEWLDGLQLAREATGIEAMTLPKKVLGLDMFYDWFQAQYKADRVLEKALSERCMSL